MAGFALPLDAALYYIGRGWYVLPIWWIRDGACACGNPRCHSPGKHPIGNLVPNGKDDATIDEAKVRDWWTRYPEANVAIATEQSGIDLLDVDPRNGGDESFRANEERFGSLGAKISANTGGGGEHHAMKSCGEALAGKPAEGIDIVTHGYFLAEPSTHISGGRYEWDIGGHPEDNELGEWNPRWLDWARRRTDEKKNGKWVEEKIRKGQRNEILFKLAASLRAKGLCQEAIEDGILAINRSACEVPLDDEEVHRIALSTSRYQPGPDKDDWPEPRKIERPMNDIFKFDSRLLPNSMARWVMDICERMQCASEYAAAPLIIALSSLIGRKVQIRPKKKDDWTVCPNLWGMSVGQPGQMKTPPANEILKPLARLEMQARKEFDEKRKDQVFEEIRNEEAIKQLRREIGKAMKNGEPCDHLKEEMRQILSEEEPTAQRYIINDATVERVGEILNENPAGLMIYRDELRGFLKNFERDGHQNDRSFYLEAWTGNGSPYTYDRIKRGTIRIEHPCVSIYGTIQPGPLDEYVRKTTENGIDSDGLLQRFQILLYPDPMVEWTNVDEWPDTMAKEQAWQTFLELDRIPTPADDEEPIILRFTEQAQGRFDEWRNKLEHRLQHPGDDHPAFTEHLTKYRSLLPSLALIFQLCDNPRAAAVDAVYVEMAAAWCRLLEDHALRVYQSVSDPAIVAATLLCNKIRDGKLSGAWTARELYRKQWTGLRNRETNQEALAHLVDTGWIRQSRDSNQKVIYETNPKAVVVKEKPDGS